MSKSSLSPVSSLITFITAVIQGKVHFPRSLVGTRITLDDGEWLVLRELVLTAPTEKPAAEAIFRPRFHVKGMNPAVNKWFSWLPIPFFAGLPGFRRKLWLLDPASGDFSGYYEWQTIGDADNYAHSFAMRFMTNRSVPGSVSARVIRREDYPCIPVSGL